RYRESIERDVLDGRRMPAAPPEPSTRHLMERTENHRNGFPVDAKAIEIVRKSVEPLRVLLMPFTTWQYGGDGARGIPCVATRHRVAHVPAERDDFAARIPLERELADLIKGHAIEIGRQTLL